MRIVDFNYHLPLEPSTKIDFNLMNHQPIDQLQSRLQSLKDSPVESANLMVLDPSFWWSPQADEFIESIPSNHSLTVLADINSDKHELLERIESLKVEGVKYHPYHQEITPDRIESVVNRTRSLTDHLKWIAVCCSYGTRRVKTIDPVRLAVELARTVDLPVVVLHGGGADVLDAMSAGLDLDNLYLELSFSLEFWKGSSIYKDFKFAVSKFDTLRILFGTDAPYVQVQDAIKTTKDFLQEANLNQKQMEAIFYRNAADLFNLRNRGLTK